MAKTKSNTSIGRKSKSDISRTLEFNKESMKAGSVKSMLKSQDSTAKSRRKLKESVQMSVNEAEGKKKKKKADSHNGKQSVSATQY